MRSMVRGLDMDKEIKTLRNIVTKRKVGSGQVSEVSGFAVTAGTSLKKHAALLGDKLDEFFEPRGKG